MAGGEASFGAEGALRAIRMPRDTITNHNTARVPRLITQQRAPRRNVLYNSRR